MFKCGQLNLILESELAKGNEVIEESAWPPKCEKLVILKDRFKLQYEEKNVVFGEIRDPHYHFFEYTTADGKECLASKI